MVSLRFVLFLLIGFVPSLVSAESWESIRDRRPELFHPETNLRIARQRAPTPDNIPAPINKITAEQAHQLLQEDAVPVDVFGALQSRFDELDGTWLVDGSRESLPGAVWLPEVGRGTLSPAMHEYLRTQLARITDGDQSRPLVVYCVSDCWMSWNASQHISALGYTQVFWLRHGTDGWLDAGFELHPVDPVPVDTD